MKKLYLILFVVIVFVLETKAQSFTLRGSVRDTMIEQSLQNAVVTVIRIQDSIMMTFVRTDDKGDFEISNLPIDTYQVKIQHPRFGTYNSFFFANAENHDFDLGRIILPRKVNDLQEVVIFAFKEPVYYSGDTLVYDATKFKTQPNATVEDLLKKLPGIDVDKDGKIKSQGKDIAKVLVDGDEFFGSDPTVATKNLAANAVESVQVYEQKKESTDASSDETEQILNIKLKEEAKKGYFGKISAGTDFMKFGEGSLLANVYNKSSKISIFSLASNTPTSNFGWEDIYKYGLNDENSVEYWEDDEMYYMFSDQNKGGLPQILKSGFYFSTKINKKLKFNTNYTYVTNLTKKTTQRNTQYVFSDTTYNTLVLENSKTQQQSHKGGAEALWDLDSLTLVRINLSAQWQDQNTESTSSQDYIDELATKTRNNTLNTNTTDVSSSYNAKISVFKKFKKEKREWNTKYQFNYKNGDQNIDFSSLDHQFILDSDTGFMQRRHNLRKTLTHLFSTSYTEPFGKYFRWENGATYDYAANISKVIANQASLIDENFYPYVNNDYKSTYAHLQGYSKLIYETKKTTASAQLKARHTEIHNIDQLLTTDLLQKYFQWFPTLRYNYKFSQNSRLSVNYNTDSKLPSISQLQPIIDNTNPNQINLGNTSLTPTYVHKLRFQYNTWKPISGKYLWSSAVMTYTQHALSNEILYDQEGRKTTRPINIDHSKSFNASVGASSKILKSDFSINTNVGYNYNDQYSYIDAAKNQISNHDINQSYGLDYDTDSFYVGINYRLNYRFPHASLYGENKPYNTQNFSLDASLKLPYKFELNTDFTYILQSKRSNGIAQSYPFWNASVQKTFTKRNLFILSAEVHDIFNKNVSFERYVSENTITDELSNLISRFFLLKLTYNFTSNKTEVVQDEF